MASSTLDKLLRIQASEATTGKAAGAGTPQAPAPPPARSGRGASPYGKQFRVVFDFLQRYTDNPPQTPEDWTAICDDLVERANESGNDQFTMDMLTAAWEQIERVYKAAKS